MEDIPLVSISCITYNHAKFVRKCLDGLLMQKTSFSYEILIHDDASIDGTVEIIKEYQKKFPHLIKPILQTENQYSKGIRGFSFKFNFPRSKGKYIAICEGDDYWTDPYKLQKQVDFMEANPEFSLCFTNGKVIDENEKVLKELQIKRRKNSVIDSEEILFVFTPTYTFLFRKEHLKFIPPELVTKVSGGDTLIKTLVSKGGPCKYLDFVSGAYRIHSGGVFSTISQFKQQKHMFYTRYHMVDYLSKQIQKRLILSLINILSLIPRPVNSIQQIELLQMHREVLRLLFRKRAFGLVGSYLKNALLKPIGRQVLKRFKV